MNCQCCKWQNKEVFSPAGSERRCSGRGISVPGLWESDRTRLGAGSPHEDSEPGGGGGGWNPEPGVGVPGTVGERGLPDCTGNFPQGHGGALLYCSRAHGISSQAWYTLGDSYISLPE